MTTEIKIRETELTVRTVKLTKALLKQILKSGYQEIGKLLGHPLKDEDVLGFINGSVLGDEWQCFLLVAIPGGDYRLLEAGMKPEEKYKQIFVA